MKTIVKNGITGFATFPNRFYPLDAELFAKMIESKLHGTVVWQDLDLNGKNYYWLLVTIHDDQYSFFMNAYFPIVAVRRETPQIKFGYLTWPEINGEFAGLPQSGYQILSKQELELRLTPDVIAGLDETEKQQVDFWKPKLVDDIVFNNWD